MATGTTSNKNAGTLWAFEELGSEQGRLGKFMQNGTAVPGLWESAERTGASAARRAAGYFSNPPDGRRAADALQEGVQWWREEALGVVTQQ